MAAVRLRLSQSFAEFEEGTNCQQKSPSRFGSTQTSWQRSVRMVLAGKLELILCFENQSNPKQARSAELRPKLTPNPSLKLSPNGVAHWPSSAGPADHFALAVQRATPSVPA